MTAQTQLLVYTDMDGTLLDHDTYSHDAALPALTTCKTNGLPVIPNTSKTYAELIQLVHELALTDPFIVENGAAIYMPADYFPNPPSDCEKSGNYWLKRFSAPQAHWQDILAKVGNKYAGSFTPFSAMSIQQICDATGLTAEAAALAAQRQFGEPVLWKGSEENKQHFIQALSELGAAPLQGGRFIHVCGECDKGTALQWLNQEFAKQYPDTHFLSVALGDSQNDVAMLEVADFAVRIRSAHHQPPELARSEHIYTSELTGPAGWDQVLGQILTRYQHG